MIEKGRISPLQLAIFLHPVIAGTVVLTVPSITMNTAGRDMWATPVVSSLFGALVIVVMCKLHERYPRETFVQYCESILGAYVGRLIALFYLVSFLYTNGLVLRQYGEFIAATFLMETPMVFVLLSLIAVSAYAVHQGLEVWARASQLLTPIALVFVLFMLVLMIPDMQVKEMFPIMEYGPLPLLRSTIVPSSWFSQFFFISFFLPYLAKKSISAMKWTFISLATIMVTILIVNLAVLLIFGNTNKGFNYPFLNAVRYISLSDFLEHIESLLMATWLVAIFIKVTMVYYVTALGSAQLLRLSDYRMLIAPIGLLMILFSIWCAPDFQELKQLIGGSVPFFYQLILMVIPLLMLGVALARGARS
ncbi:endospore germination permease [Paenibacillus rhizovicinus]|uniref:Endospore germination permease n=1 Tax=Paenibacillus rhizovicinus TaxID=2704463 RepID=A0A6C0P4L1_9BACL|nr:endospore germination permease [Paenibacillus rhizovicinus]QHW33196.1 endospore germination permease [Paenibacillus rhizovicinus]